MMPRISGDKIQDRISVTLTPLNKRDIEKAIDEKEFSSIANLINTAIRFYFDNRNKSGLEQSKSELESFLTSPAGGEWLNKLLENSAKNIKKE